MLSHTRTKQFLLYTGMQHLLIITLLISCWHNSEAQSAFVSIENPFEAVSFSAVAFADIDQDMDMDVLISGIISSRSSPYTSYATKLYENNGYGIYTLKTNTPFKQVCCGSLTFADIDNDEDPDLFITGRNESGPISELYRNDGTGKYTLIPDTPFENSSDGGIAFADIDNDGDQDLLVSGQTDAGSISNLYVNDGTGTYSLVIDTPFTKVRNGTVDFADINNDGDQDVLITGYQNGGSISVSILYANDGHGTFSPIEAPFDHVGNSAVDFADIDHDNDLDVLIAGYNGLMHISNLYINDGHGTFSLAANNPFPGLTDGSVIFADMDNDGSQDVFISGYEKSPKQGVANVYYNDGTGAYALGTELYDTELFFAVGGIADIDNDRDLDIFITGLNADLQPVSKVFRNEGPVKTAIIEHTFEKDILVYPNPTNGYVTIEGSGWDITEIVVSDITGNMMYKNKELISEMFELSIADMDNGLYILKIQSDRHQKIVRLIKQ